MINEKVVIINGASSRIGKTIAKLIAGKGAKIVLGARRESVLKQVVDEIKVDGGQVPSVPWFPKPSCDRRVCAP